MKRTKVRYYLHGDQSETAASLYYCASCDLFEPHKHFLVEHPGNRIPHDRKYRSTKRVWLKLRKQRARIATKTVLYRPDTAPSVFDVQFWIVRH